jgi:hypothetical protein
LVAVVPLAADPVLPEVAPVVIPLPVAEAPVEVPPPSGWPVPAVAPVFPAEDCVPPVADAEPPAVPTLPVDVPEPDVAPEVLTDVAP